MLVNIKYVYTMFYMFTNFKFKNLNRFKFCGNNLLQDQKLLQKLKNKRTKSDLIPKTEFLLQISQYQICVGNVHRNIQEVIPIKQLQLLKVILLNWIFFLLLSFYYKSIFPILTFSEREKIVIIYFFLFILINSNTCWSLLMINYVETFFNRS